MVPRFSTPASPNKCYPQHELGSGNLAFVSAPAFRFPPLQFLHHELIPNELRPKQRAPPAPLLESGRITDELMQSLVTRTHNEKCARAGGEGATWEEGVTWEEGDRGTHRMPGCRCRRRRIHPGKHPRRTRIPRSAYLTALRVTLSLFRPPPPPPPPPPSRRRRRPTNARGGRRNASDSRRRRRPPADARWLTDLPNTFTCPLQSITFYTPIYGQQRHLVISNRTTASSARGAGQRALRARASGRRARCASARALEFRPLPNDIQETCIT